MENDPITISGFTFVRNASKLFIPVRESITSILPLVDEFVIAIGKGDEDDNTEELIDSLGSEKIRKVHTEWDPEEFPRNTVFAQQTDVAKDHCKGDWLFYLQCDEVIHEQDLSKVRAACEKLHNDDRIEGLLFKYRHFWGDYDHVHFAHNWYPKEIRVIRNLPEIHSWRDAQSFRYYERFDGTSNDYLRSDTSRRLRVAELDAWVYHYGGVRPPDMMRRKKRTSSKTYHGEDRTRKKFNSSEKDFDYGPLNLLDEFKGTHPEVMNERIQRMDWQDQLQYNGKPDPGRKKHKHERLKYRILGYFEHKFLDSEPIGGFRNYKTIRKF